MAIVDFDEMKDRQKPDVTADLIREKLIEHAKSFKVSWVKLGQSLYPVWKDKFFYNWGFDKFEDYVSKELGMNKNIALKLLKTYFFLEQEESAYLTEDFQEKRKANQVPACDAINVLRLARQKKELTRDDYLSLKKAVFDDGREAGLLRKDLTSLMKQRKEVDPEEERQKRSDQAVKKMVNAILSFKRDMDALKLVPAEIVKEAEVLLDKLQQEFPDQAEE